MGRWSSRIAKLFLYWLAPQPDARWVEVGCGTGALSRTIIDSATPRHVTGIDPSKGFLAHAAALTEGHVAFRFGDAQALELEDGSVDYAVSAFQSTLFRTAPRP